MPITQKAANKLQRDLEIQIQLIIDEDPRLRNVSQKTRRNMMYVGAEYIINEFLRDEQPEPSAEQGG